MSYQTINNNPNEEVLLLNEAAPSKSNSILPKVILAGVTSFILIAVLAVYRPTKMQDVFSSMTDLQHSQFAWDYSRATPNNANGGINFLDRHDVDCSNNPMNGFRGGSSFYYECQVTHQHPIRVHQLSSNPEHYGGVEYLDRQHVWCPHNTLLSQFRLQSHYWMGKVNFQFKCVEYNAIVTNCQDQYTNFNDRGGGIIYLDRHWAFCDNSRALVGFSGQTGWWWTFRWHYRCCQLISHNPTPQPIANPTHHPIAHPTHHPIAFPTHHPVAKPTEHPTHHPIASPTEHPIAKPTEHPTHHPIASPTEHPIATPTEHPSHHPTHHPVAEPTDKPNADPTNHPIAEPTMAPNPVVQEKLEQEMQKEAEKENKELKMEIKDDENKLLLAENLKSKSEEVISEIKEEVKELEVKMEEAKKDEEVAKEAQVSANDAEKAGVEVRFFKGEDSSLGDLGQKNFDSYKELLKDAEEKVEEEKSRIEDLSSEIKDKLEEIKKEEKIVQDSASEIKKIQKEIQDDKESIKVNEKVVDEIDKIEKEAGEGLVCHFTFESGITKIVVPDGCVFFGETDIHVAQQKTMITPALYVCADKHSPNLITSDIFKKYGLVTDKKSKISMVKPGDSAKVEFYSHDDLKGSKGVFTRKTYKSLTTYYYKDNRESANDNVKSALVTSSTESFPDSCKELKYSDKMSLISETKFHSKK